MKRMIVLIVLALIVVSSIFYSVRPRKTIDLNGILNNLNEYNNPLYLGSLTQKQKEELVDSLDQLFNETCKTKEGCSIPFLFVYMDTKLNLGLSPDNILNEDAKKIIMTAYSDLPRNLTENDLRGFAVPFITRLCRIGMINQSEKVSWIDRIINVEKTAPVSTFKKALYFSECLDANTITDLNKWNKFG